MHRHIGRRWLQTQVWILPKESKVNAKKTGPRRSLRDTDTERVNGCSTTTRDSYYILVSWWHRIKIARGKAPET